MKHYGMLPWKKELKGEHIYITGAGSGIGRIMAQKLAAMGNSVSCVDIDKAAAEETAVMIVKEGHKAIGIYGDVTSSQDIS